MDIVEDFAHDFVQCSIPRDQWKKANLYSQNKERADFPKINKLRFKCVAP